MDERVVITGIGMVTSLGHTREATWRGMVEGHCGIRAAELFDTAGYHSRIAAEVQTNALNSDLSREYQAVIAYVVYSQVIKGAEYMAIARELEQHAAEELAHALTISKHIDYLGGTPTTKALEVKMSDDPRQLLRFDLDNENETIKNYRTRVRQCEAMQEYAIAEDIREILRQEQEHQTDLATALGEEVPDVSDLAGSRR